MSRFGHQALTPVLQKSESFRVKASEGEVVVIYFKPSATQDLKFSGFPTRVNNMAKSTPSLKFTWRNIQKKALLQRYCI